MLMDFGISLTTLNNQLMAKTRKAKVSKEEAEEIQYRKDLNKQIDECIKKLEEMRTAEDPHVLVVVSNGHSNIFHREMACSGWAIHVGQAIVRNNILEDIKEKRNNLIVLGKGGQA
jgi:urocanate hydratase